MATQTIRRIIRNLAEGSEVDWSALDEPRMSTKLAALGRELRTIAEIERVHQTAAAHRSAPTAAPGTWGSLAIVAHLGSGSFGDVYRAWDPHLEREVALKLLRRREGDQHQFTAVREGRLLARIRHPNVVTVYGANRISGSVGLWMELIAGETLEARLRRLHVFTAADVMEIGVQVCRGLAAVHRAGVLHCDVKAHNIMRDETGRVVLMDFGAGADAAAGEQRKAGTPLYMAPELFEGGAATQQSDVFSVGVLLYRLCTGSYPYRGGNIEEIRLAHRDAPALMTTLTTRGAPAPLARVIEKAMRVEPEDRFKDIRELEDALAGYAADAPAGERVVARTTPGARQLLPAVALALVTSIAVGSLVPSTPSDPATGAAASGSSVTERIQVLLVPFDNRSGESALDAVVERLLARELLESSLVHVVPRSRIEDTLALMRLPADTPVTRENARDLALRDGDVPHILTGSVVKVGSQYLLGVTLRNAVTDRTLGVAEEMAAHIDDVPAAGRRLAVSVRRLVGEPRVSVSTAPGLERVTTPSMRSLRLYSESYEMGDRGLWDAALSLVNEAVAADPQFAAAQTWLAWTLHNTGASPEQYLPVATRALELSSAASPWERHWIRGSYYSLSAEHAAAIGEYQALIRLRPEMTWPYGNLAMAYEALGRSAELPVDIVTAGADLRPNNPRANAVAVQALLVAGDRQRAANYASRVHRLAERVALRGNHQTYRSMLLPAEEAWRQGDIRAAVRWLRSHESGDAFVAGHGRLGFVNEVFWTYLRMGRLADARRVADTLPSPLDTHLLLAVAAHFSGDVHATLQATERASVDRPVGDAQWPMLAWIQAQHGEIARARDANRRATAATRTNTEGHIALAEGEVDGAIALLQQDPRALGPGITLRTRIALARGYALKRDLTRAIATLAPLEQEDGLGTFSEPLFRMQALLDLAGYYRRAERPERARRIERRLGPLFAGADDNFTLRRQFQRLR